MASKRKQGSPALSKSQFAESLFKIAHRFSLHQVFEDFLTMLMAACTQNIQTGQSWYEDEYLQTIAPYKDSELRHEFPKAFVYLIAEMEDRVHSDLGNDVLGEFFEQHISNGRNGQYFTPYHICKFMASITHTDSVAESEKESTRSLRILDPACGSGRMLLASRHQFGQGHEYYGIDIDRTCAKIAALNLFLNGMWSSEVMCANALSPYDFVISYRISLVPLGIFKVTNKEESRLWNLHKNSFTSKGKTSTGEMIQLNPIPIKDRPKDDGTQLNLF